MDGWMVGWEKGGMRTFTSDDLLGHHCISGGDGEIHTHLE